jgi:peroxisomal enoyl-CoA hydratase 2
MSNIADPKAFADPEDSAVVAEAKQEVYDPVDYSYTEVLHYHQVRFTMSSVC